MGTPVIVDFGLINVGEHWDKGLDDLASEAGLKLVDRYKELIEAVYIGNMLSQYFNLQGNLGSYITELLGLSDIDVLWINNAEASSSSSLYVAAKTIKSGLYSVVMVGGVEKTTDVMARNIVQGVSLSIYNELVNRTGITLAGIAALLMKEYIKRYNVDRKYISYLSVQDHENAVTAEHAQYRNKVSIDKIMSSPMIADPLTIFDAAPYSDGAAFVLLMDESLAKEYGLKYVRISGSGMSMQSVSILDRDDFLEFKATERATQKALNDANVDISKINIFEVNDDFSITGILSLEAIGLFERGTAAYHVYNGETKLDGKYPVNTFGGLKARGHPIGATGLYQVIEVCMQLMKKAGKNQVNNPKYGLVQNYGGLDSISTVFVLEAVEDA